MDPNSIKEKATRWRGRGHELHDSKEQYKIHFLLGEPKRPGTEQAYEHAKHILAKIPGQTELIAENEIESFAESVAAEIVRHLDEGH